MLPNLALAFLQPEMSAKQPGYFAVVLIGSLVAGGVGWLIAAVLGFARASVSAPQRLVQCLGYPRLFHRRALHQPARHDVVKNVKQAAGIEHLHERQVAHLERIGGLEVEQPRHLIDIERVRQTLAGFRGRDVERRIALEHALALQEGEECAQCREAALDAAALEAACVSARGEGAHVLVIERVPSLDALLLAPLHQRLEIVAIGGQGVRGQTTFRRQVAFEAFEPLPGFGVHGNRAWSGA